jgi:hypothetical protein
MFHPNNHLELSDHERFSEKANNKGTSATFKFKALILQLEETVMHSKRKAW